MIQAVFVVGNKRSGTSQLVRMVNLHPQVFISHESDVAWILYLYHQQRAFAPHPWDSGRGMQLTLDNAAGLLRPDAAPWDNFLAMQRSVMRAGTPWLPAENKPELLWIGDKKPFQHTDKAVLDFILLQFPGARFLHMVRHPYEVVASSDRFNQTADGDFWMGLSARQKLERWAFHEESVLRLHQRLPGRVYSLRYEDFCRDTRAALAAVFRFLGVDTTDAMLEAARQNTRPPTSGGRALRASDKVKALARRYGYDLAATT